MLSTIIFINKLNFIVVYKICWILQLLVLFCMILAIIPKAVFLTKTNMMMTILFLWMPRMFQVLVSEPTSDLFIDF